MKPWVCRNTNLAVHVLHLYQLPGCNSINFGSQSESRIQIDWMTPFLLLQELGKSKQNVRSKEQCT